MITIVISFLLTVVFQIIFLKKICILPFFQRNESVEGIKKSCIKELHREKTNTPVMGGITINLCLLLSVIVYGLLFHTILWINALLLLFGLMGFTDDYIKLKKPKDGVSPSVKLLGLVLISSVIILFLYNSNQLGSGKVYFPFVGSYINLGILVYIILMIIITVAASNSMNLTDGLDGLALGISSIILAYIGIVAWSTHVKDVFFTSMVLLGSCLGTLLFNKNPAKIFMGDTGSLLLGGSIAVLLIRLNLPLWIIIVMAVCIFETISVILQLTSLKLFKKKIFKIAPFHHHLEKCGWKETKITYVFWSITAILCLGAYFV